MKIFVVCKSMKKSKEKKKKSKEKFKKSKEKK